MIKGFMSFNIGLMKLPLWVEIWLEMVMK